MGAGIACVVAPSTQERLTTDLSGRCPRGRKYAKSCSTLYISADGGLPEFPQSARATTTVLLWEARAIRVSSTQKSNQEDEAALIARIRSGDDSAMGDLYDRYSGVVYGIALRVLGNTTAAEDVMQEIFLQLWRNPQAFRPERGSLAPWLAVIARNRAIDVVRKRRPEEDIHELPIAGSVDLEEEAARKIAVEKVRGVLAQLPTEQRKALEMAYFEGLTQTEIAGKTGEPLGTVKTRIRSGLMALRKAFA